MVVLETLLVSWPDLFSAVESRAAQVMAGSRAADLVRLVDCLVVAAVVTATTAATTRTMATSRRVLVVLVASEA